MFRILLFFISLVVFSSVWSADDFFEKKPSILIACVGNSLVADDAAGCKVYEMLQKQELSKEQMVLAISR